MLCMNKYIVGAAVICGALIIMFLARTNSTAEEIRIGAIVPLSGELAYIGEEINRGMQLALDDYKDLHIKLMVEDDNSLDSKASVNAMQKLIATDYDDIILDTAVNASKALSPIAESQKVPVVVLWDSSNELLRLSDWVLAMGFSLEAAGEDVASYAHDNLNLNKVAIIGAQDEWSETVSKAFIAQFTTLGGEIVLHERTPIEQADFKTSISKAKAAGAESIYFPHYPQGNTIIVKQARELGFVGPLLTGDVFSDANVEALGEQAENIHLAQLWLDDPAFKAKYAAKFGKTPDKINIAFAAIGYDGIKLVATVYQELKAQGKEPTNENIRTHLRGLKFKGVTGVTEFDSEGRSHKRERILKVENGAFTLVK